MLENIKINDEIKCDSCHGKGWNSMETDYDCSEHLCTNCEGAGYLIVMGFNNSGAILRSPTSEESGFVAGEIGMY